ncbi:hypothetical protein ERJ75_001317900 [Trypanosoma vivax]|nr:hypothetical protein ERJ75_001317900 [Trypanosoma vivax]
MRPLLLCVSVAALYGCCLLPAAAAAAILSKRLRGNSHRSCRPFIPAAAAACLGGAVRTRGAGSDQGHFTSGCGAALAGRTCMRAARWLAMARARQCRTHREVRVRTARPPHGGASDAARHAPVFFPSPSCAAPSPRLLSLTAHARRRWRASVVSSCGLGVWRAQCRARSRACAPAACVARAMPKQALGVLPRPICPVRRLCARRGAGLGRATARLSPTSGAREECASSRRALPTCRHERDGSPGAALSTHGGTQ